MSSINRCWAIYPLPEKGASNAFAWMVESAAKHGIELEILFAENLSVEIDNRGVALYYEGKSVAPPCFALMRHYDDRLSRTLEIMGVRVINNSLSMSLSRDKYLTHVTLVANNIPTPQTFYQCSDYNAIINSLGTPFIFKSIQGSKGEEVFLIDSEDMFRGCVLRHPSYIVQRYVVSSYGRDIRVWVVGGRAVAATMRHNATSFKSNLALGGEALPYPMTDDIAQIATASCDVLGIELAGVDILLGDDDKPIVCEVNGNAGFRAFSMYEEQVDIPYYIFEYVATLIK